MALHGLTAAAAALALLTIAGIVWKIFEGAWPAIQEFGLSFVWESAWNPITEDFGAREFVIGTLVTHRGAAARHADRHLDRAVPEHARPAAVRSVVGPLVEMLAAVPSVILGFWGILVLGPFIQRQEPFLHESLGFIPISAHRRRAARACSPPA